MFGEGPTSNSPFFRHDDSQSLIKSKRRASRRRSSLGKEPDWYSADAAGWFKNEFPIKNNVNSDIVSSDTNNTYTGTGVSGDINNNTGSGNNNNTALGLTAGVNNVVSARKDMKRGIFVTTFNLGEAELQFDELEAWLPRGYDVYAIGVQECMILPQLKSAILSHLNMTTHEGNGVISHQDSSDSGSTTGTGTTYKASSQSHGYVMHCREIGSTKTNMGFHGMIAIMVSLPLYKGVCVLYKYTVCLYKCVCRKCVLYSLYCVYLYMSVVCNVYMSVERVFYIKCSVVLYVNI